MVDMNSVTDLAIFEQSGVGGFFRRQTVRGLISAVTLFYHSLFISKEVQFKM